jgi:hypothetical protein
MHFREIKMLREVMFVDLGATAAHHPIMLSMPRHLQRPDFPGITIEREHFNDETVTTAGNTKRTERMHALSVYQAPLTFSIPAQTGLLITTSSNEEFLSFLIYNMFKDAVIHVAMGTRLSHLLNVVDFSRCPKSLYDQLKKQQHRVDKLMSIYFNQTYYPLMRDDTHDDIYSDDDEDDAPLDPVRYFFFDS